MSYSRPPRRGFTLTELMVGASLLVTMMAFVAPLSIRTGRLWQDTRQQQLALDELSNQLDQLTALDSDDVDEAIARLEMSAPLKAALPRATIEGEVVRDADATQLILTLRWDDAPSTVPRRAPITLVGWLVPRSLRHSSKDVDSGSQTAAEEEAS